METLSKAICSNEFHQVITANALLILEAESNAALDATCHAASLVIPESAGAIWAIRRLGGPETAQIAGVDLAFKLCEMTARLGKSVFLLGGKPGVSEAAAHYLLSKIPHLDVAGTLDGFFNPDRDEVIVNAIRDSGASLCLVAMGMPFQDVWIHSRREVLPGAVFMGVGGTFDVWAGNVKRAPLWFQHRGLEWLYRFWQEPSRWPRMAQLPVFALKVALSRRKI